MPSNPTTTPHQPTFPLPVSGPRDALNLQKRINWSNDVKQNRNISPNMMTVITCLRENCEQLLAAGKDEENKKALLDKNIEALDAALESRWTNEQGPNGLVQVVIDSINAMMELRMWLEYGDYLALHCEQINQGDMRDLLWKTTEKCDWQEVARRITSEEKTLDDHYQNPDSVRPETPWLDDVKTAAERKSLDLNQTIFEIKGYAARNAAGHIGIGRMLDECNWQDLAERVLYDKATMNTVFANEPKKGVMMRVAVGRLANQWFSDIWWYNERV